MTNQDSNTISYKSAIEIVAQESAKQWDEEMLKHIRKYASDSGIDDVTVINDKALKEVLIQGVNACRKIYGDDFAFAIRMQKP